MLGYAGHAEQDKSKYRGNWFLTQDLVSMDEDGYITYYGRADSVIKVSGGFRVSPVEIENVLKLYPDIIDAACGPYYDTTLNEDILAAYIVSLHPSRELAEKICAYTKKYLSDYKVPNRVHFVKQLPYNARGKLIRHELAKTAVIKECDMRYE